MLMGIDLTKFDNLSALTAPYDYHKKICKGQSQLFHIKFILISMAV